MTELNHSIGRDVVIAARRETVFAYFQDNERFARWWGEGSSIDARPGGAMRIRYPNGETASGQVIEVTPPSRVVFTYGYDNPDKPIAPGGSRVTVELTEVPEGTRVSLRHDVADSDTAQAHVPGWRYQLAVFANVVSAEQHAGAAAVIDRYLAAWSTLDDAERGSLLLDSVTDDVRFQDPYACIHGRDELAAHIAAAQMHFGAARLSRDGDPRHCQGTILADWRVVHPDGAELGRGTNVYTMSGDGRVRGVVGIATPA